MEAQTVLAVLFVYAEIHSRADRQVGVRGSPERDISSLRAFGPGWGQVLRVVRVTACAPLGYIGKSSKFMHRKRWFYVKRSTFMHESATFL